MHSFIFQQFPHSSSPIKRWIIIDPFVTRPSTVDNKWKFSSDESSFNLSEDEPEAPPSSQPQPAKGRATQANLPRPKQPIKRPSFGDCSLDRSTLPPSREQFFFFNAVAAELPRSKRKK